MVLTALTAFGTSGRGGASSSFAGAARKALRRPARLAVPLRLTEGAESLAGCPEAHWLELRSLEEGSSRKPFADFEAGIPEEKDLDELASLLIDSFIKVFQPRLLPEASLGPLAKAWNGFVLGFEKSVAKVALGQNMAFILRRPSIKRPQGRFFEGYGVGLMLWTRDKNAEGMPVAFCELCLLVPDGRKLGDLKEILSLLKEEPKDKAQPYLHNFCVAQGWRRQGLGRALLNLAEKVVKEVWLRDRLYLHAGDDDGAASLYASAGYVEIAASQSSESGSENVVHMYKELV